jgi:GTP-binding protein HflX
LAPHNPINDLSRSEVARERAVLVKLITPRNAAEMDARNPLGELKALAEAAGAEVVDALLQKRMTIQPRTHIGKGKVEELCERIAANSANLIIFDDDLTPAQIRSVEEETKCRVIDRGELILDIFATRARTHEARLQVEIAQLEYTAPRLRGMWQHLERIAGAGGGTQAGAIGGIGTRGPGERQIEIDRRIVRDRVSALRREIARIDRRKTREVLSRRDEFTVSLVGYTNAGKSTLMNTLTGAGQDSHDMVFATLDTRTARWELGGGRHALLSDTVGFVRSLPHKLVASFKATLEEAIHAQLLLHVVDASARDAMRQVEVVRGVLAELGCDDNPTIVVLNKIDQAEDEALIAVAEEKYAPAVRLSAKTGEGVERLFEMVRERIGAGTVRVTVRLPAHEGKLITLLTRLAETCEPEYGDGAVEMKLTIDRTQLEQLAHRYPTMQLVGTDQP